MREAKWGRSTKSWTGGVEGHVENIREDAALHSSDFALNRALPPFRQSLLTKDATYCRPGGGCDHGLMVAEKSKRAPRRETHAVRKGLAFARSCASFPSTMRSMGQGRRTGGFSRPPQPAHIGKKGSGKTMQDGPHVAAARSTGHKRTSDAFAILECDQDSPSNHGGAGPVTRTRDRPVGHELSEGGRHPRREGRQHEEVRKEHFGQRQIGSNAPAQHGAAQKSFPLSQQCARTMTPDHSRGAYGKQPPESPLGRIASSWGGGQRPEPAS